MDKSDKASDLNPSELLALAAEKLGMSTGTLIRHHPKNMERGCCEASTRMNRWIEWDRGAQAEIEALAGGWLDWPMHVFSELTYFMPVLVATWIWLVWRGGPRGRALAFVAVLLVLLSDRVSASVLKPWFARPRPHSPEPGFPSSHASNLFAQATLFSYFYPNVSVVLLTVACATGFSRVYLGKHYPFDVLGGALLGALCGTLAIWVVLRRTSDIEWFWRRVFAALPEKLRPTDVKTSPSS